MTLKMTLDANTSRAAFQEEFSANTRCIKWNSTTSGNPAPATGPAPDRAPDSGVPNSRPCCTPPSPLDAGRQPGQKPLKLPAIHSPPFDDDDWPTWRRRWRTEKTSFSTLPWAVSELQELSFTRSAKIARCMMMSGTRTWPKVNAKGSQRGAAPRARESRRRGYAPRVASRIRAVSLLR